MVGVGTVRLDETADMTFRCWKLVNCDQFPTHTIHWSVTFSADEMSKSHERPDAIADDLEDGEQRHGEQRTGDAPHPIPEDQRDDDQDRIEFEAPCQQQRRHSAFGEVDRQIAHSRHERLPNRVEGEDAGQKQNGNAAERTQDENVIQNEGENAP